jgi:hypothetical protein
VPGHPYVSRFNSLRYDTCDASDVARIKNTIKESNQFSSNAFNNLAPIKRDFEPLDI